MKSCSGTLDGFTKDWFADRDFWFFGIGYVVLHDIGYGVRIKQNGYKKLGFRGAFYCSGIRFEIFGTIFSGYVNIVLTVQRC